MMPSDLGAEVVKIEKSDGGDETRSWGPWINGTSYYFEALNRGKKSTGQPSFDWEISRTRFLSVFHDLLTIGGNSRFAR